MVWPLKNWPQSLELFLWLVEATMLGFTMAPQKLMGDITENIFMFYAVYGAR